jgi:hypothetical protein
MKILNIIDSALIFFEISRYQFDTNGSEPDFGLSIELLRYWVPDAIFTIESALVSVINFNIGIGIGID